MRTAEVETRQCPISASCDQLPDSAGFIRAAAGSRTTLALAFGARQTLFSLGFGGHWILILFKGRAAHLMNEGVTCYGYVAFYVAG
jgi:hypothetical protein